MYRSKFRLILLAVSLGLIITLMGLLGAFAYYIPDTPISLAVFKASYMLCPVKKSFLEFYSPAGRNFGVNTRSNIKENVFLLQRLETTDSENEVSAIAHYYALQSKEREYDIFLNVSERARPLIIGQLIKELDDNSSQLSDKVMLLETTRTGKRIGKGAIRIDDPNIPKFPASLTMEESERLFNEYLAKTGVKQKYREWWNSNLSWEEKKKINPLAGTNIKVSECCG